MDKFNDSTNFKLTYLLIFKKVYYRLTYYRNISLIEYIPHICGKTRFGVLCLCENQWYNNKLKVLYYEEYIKNITQSCSVELLQ